MIKNSKIKSHDNSFVRFHRKGTGEKKCEYGSVQRSVWVNGTCKSETLLWLGKVLNKEQMIFQSRENGIFKFTPPSTISRLSAGEVITNRLTDYDKTTEKTPLIGEEYARIFGQANSLSFGGVYLASEVLKQSGLTDIFTTAFAGTKALGEAVMPLVIYKLTQGGASMRIKTWWEQSYAKFLYPHLNLESPRITQLLREIGQDKYWRIFFKNYSEFIAKQTSIKGTIIDSTGLPKAINTDLWQIRDHGDVINREKRLIVVLEKNSGYPLYFKYLPDNIVDKSTLQHLFYEMEAYDIEVSSAILDAGYYSEDNLQFLFDRGVTFMTGYIPNLKVYKRIIKNDINDIDDLAYHTMKGARFMKIKVIKVGDIGTMNLYAYICKDLVEANKQEFHILRKFNYDIADEKEIAEIQEKLRKRGIFILISSIELSKNEVLPFYYERQDIEQIFDFAKNDLDLLPLRTHSHETLRGHFMVVFMASIAHVHMRRILEKRKNIQLSRSAVFDILSRHCTKVYEDKNFHLPDIPSPLLRNIYETFNVDVPTKMYIL
ncbi:MAG: transposase [Deltaproteobacteria bacterium]|jgi:hypothetical protein|nr:transposase [Deltaproteobacteria bacterium]